MPYVDDWVDSLGVHWSGSGLVLPSVCLRVCLDKHHMWRLYLLLLRTNYRELCALDARVHLD